jgi:hypothetical protein
MHGRKKREGLAVRGVRGVRDGEAGGGALRGAGQMCRGGVVGRAEFVCW